MVDVLWFCFLFGMMFVYFFIYIDKMDSKGINAKEKGGKKAEEERTC